MLSFCLLQLLSNNFVIFTNGKRRGRREKYSMSMIIWNSSGGPMRLELTLLPFFFFFFFSEHVVVSQGVSFPAMSCQAEILSLQQLNSVRNFLKIPQPRPYFWSIFDCFTGGEVELQFYTAQPGFFLPSSGQTCDWKLAWGCVILGNSSAQFRTQLLCFKLGKGYRSRLPFIRAQ